MSRIVPYQIRIWIRRNAEVHKIQKMYGRAPAELTAGATAAYISFHIEGYNTLPSADMKYYVMFFPC